MLDLHIPDTENYQEQSQITNKELQKLVEQISQQFFQLPFQHTAFFNPRLKTTGGRYHLTTHHLDFNPKVFEKYGFSELINVIKHELCHYHLHLQGRGYRHRDAEFKHLLSKTGGSRFVRPLIEQKPENYYQYECTKCQTLLLRKRRVNLKKYVCGKCSGQLCQIFREN